MGLKKLNIWSWWSSLSKWILLRLLEVLKKSQEPIFNRWLDEAASLMISDHLANTRTIKLVCQGVIYFIFCADILSKLLGKPNWIELDFLVINQLFVLLSEPNWTENYSNWSKSIRTNIPQFLSGSLTSHDPILNYLILWITDTNWNEYPDTHA